jgi:phospholipid/cholesterol/gamma-HCH transport system substrate-binding protein
MKKPSPTLIGAFVLGAIALIVAGVVFFGAGALPKERIRMVSFFHGSVAGLRVGAAVTFRGVRVGEVTSIGIRFDTDTRDSIIQVNMELRPETVTAYGAKPPKTEDMVPEMVRRGLTAQLVLESFVTRLLEVDLDFRPGARVSRMGGTERIPEVPTVPGEWEGITKQLQEADIAATLASFKQALNTVNEILTSDDVKQTIHQLPLVMTDLRHAVNTVDREVAAFSRDGRAAISKASASLDKTLASADTLARDLDREAPGAFAAARGTFEHASGTLDRIDVLLDPRGRTMVQVQRAVDDLAATAARLRNFSERVDRDPSVLVRGR